LILSLKSISVWKQPNFRRPWRVLSVFFFFFFFIKILRVLLILSLSHWVVNKIHLTQLQIDHHRLLTYFSTYTHLVAIATILAKLPSHVTIESVVPTICLQSKSSTMSRSLNYMYSKWTYTWHFYARKWWVLQTKKKTLIVFALWKLLIASSSSPYYFSRFTF